MDQIVPFLEKLSGASLGGICVLIIYGSYKGIWVWGSVYRKVETERDMWRGVALKNANLAVDSTSLARSAIALHPGSPS